MGVIDVAGVPMVCPPLYVADSSKVGVCALAAKTDDCAARGLDANCDPRTYVHPTGGKWPNSKWCIPTEGAPTLDGCSVIWQSGVYITNGVPLSYCYDECNVVADVARVPVVCPPLYVAHGSKKGVCSLEANTDGCAAKGLDASCDPRTYVHPTGGIWPNSNWCVPVEDSPKIDGCTVRWEGGAYTTNGVHLAYCSAATLTPAPTLKPTLLPTQIPTSSPVLTPTEVPTSRPTL